MAFGSGGGDRETENDIKFFEYPYRPTSTCVLLGTFDPDSTGPQTPLFSVTPGDYDINLIFPLESGQGWARKGLPSLSNMLFKGIRWEDDPGNPSAARYFLERDELVSVSSCPDFMVNSSMNSTGIPIREYYGDWNEAERIFNDYTTGDTPKNIHDFFSFFDSKRPGGSRYSAMNFLPFHIIVPPDVSKLRGGIRLSVILRQIKELHPSMRNLIINLRPQ